MDLLQSSNNFSASDVRSSIRRPAACDALLSLVSLLLKTACLRLAVCSLVTAMAHYERSEWRDRPKEERVA